MGQTLKHFGHKTLMRSPDLQLLPRLPLRLLQIGGRGSPVWQCGRAHYVSLSIACQAVPVPNSLEKRQSTTWFCQECVAPGKKVPETAPR